MYITDIFSSIHGEGIYVGYRQLFIRFAGCNIACDYCDENVGEGMFYDAPAVLAKIGELGQGYHHSVSLTGGEPLLQIGELIRLLPEIKLPKYLETNATLPTYLAEIKPLIDIFSLDYKPGYESEFAQSLELVKGEDTFVKYILLPKPNMADFKKAVELVAGINKETPFIIQPVTPHKLIKHMPMSDEIFAAYNLAKRKLSEVRVIPQTHKILHIK